MHKFVLYLFLASMLSASGISAEITLIPQPVELYEKKGRFLISGLNYEGNVSASFREIADNGIAGFGLDHTTGHLLTLKLAPYVNMGPEQYHLEVSPTQAVATAKTEAGLFYALQTIYQLIDERQIPCLVINDQPRYEWRGLHLDVSRHFFDVDSIKRYINLMALYKYNVFHWHLTDDDGWRIESKHYPKLTKIGAWRSSVGRSGNQAKGLNTDDGEPYGGFYTQDEIREIVAYAAERHIDILPEIDVPGHSRAIIQAYPEFGASGNVLNVGNPDTIKFLEDIFSEAAALFPFGKMHIGCDEVGLGAWKRHPDCIQKMEELGTDNPHDLHRWLVHHLQKHLAGKNKEAIAWCEVLDANIDSDTVVMCWRDNGGWITAPKRGHKIVVTPSMQTYFNYQEDIKSNAPGHGGYRTIMEKVYKFNPTDSSLTNEQKALVLGGQGCVWTEYIPHLEHVEYIAYPRAVALSEALWSPLESKDWDYFQDRLEKHLPYLDRHKVNYRIGAPIPPAKKIRFEGSTQVKLTNPNRQGSIHYTLDGNTPTASSPKYNEATGILIDEACTLKAIVVHPNGRTSYTTILDCAPKQLSPVRFKNFKIETNMRSTRGNIPAHVLDGDSETFFWAGHGVNPANHFTVLYDQPIQARSIHIQTGKPNGGDQLQAADLEVSYDGETFIKLADFTGGQASGAPVKDVHSIRIQIIRSQGEWLVIRSIEVE